MIAFRAAPRVEHSLAGARDLSTDVRAALKQQQPRCVWLTGLSGLGQVVDRQPARAAPVAAGRHTYRARRRQRPSWPQSRSRLHGGRSRREYPARRRSRAADGRCRARSCWWRSSRRSAPSAGWRAGYSPKATSSKCSWTRHSRNANGAIPKASTPRLAAARLPNFTASTAPTKPPDAPDLHLVTTGRSIEVCAEQVFDTLR